MKIELDDLQATIVRGARVAYNLDNPPAFGTPFGEWLGRSVSITRATGRSEIVTHLAELCRRAIEGHSRFSLHATSEEDQRAVRLADAAFQGLSELEEVARLAVDERVS